MAFSKILGHKINTATMKLLFVFLVIATVVTLIKGYSEDDHWKDFKVNKFIA